jgi:hypothetical protein
MTCRICKSPTEQSGLLYRCTSASCGAAHWDKLGVRRIVQNNKDTAKEKSPSWVISILESAKVPQSVSGEKYVYTIKLRKNLPKKTSSQRRERMPNSGNGRFYVGKTGLHPFARYLNHLRGYKASWAAKNMAVSMITYEGPMSDEEATKREPKRANELMELGFDVHSN